MLVVPNKQLSAGILVELKTPGFKMLEICGIGVVALVGVVIVAVFVLELQAQRIRIMGIKQVIRRNLASMAAVSLSSRIWHIEFRNIIK